MRKSITLFEDQYAFYKELKSEKLLAAFVEYMFEDIEPQWLNSLEQTIWNSLVDRMNSWKAKCDAWSKWWSNSKWGWRPTKSEENNNQETSRKQAENKQKTNEEQPSISISKSISISNKEEDKEINKEDMCNKLHDEYWFEKFWNEYPNKKDKKKAQEKFNKMNVEKRKLAIEWISKLRNSEQWRKWFIPMPTTYLNGERWEDEVDNKMNATDDYKERERQRRLQEAQEVLNRNKNQNEGSYQTQATNRRANIIGM